MADVTATAVPHPAPEVFPVVPRYGESSLAELLPSVLAGMGVLGADRKRLDLPERPRVCILLIDGLGLCQLREHRDVAPFLSSLIVAGHELTAGFPSTTATSLSSLGTGTAPGQHGLLGFEMYVPELGRAMNCLRWDESVNPTAFQPLPTAFEDAAAAGVAVTRVGPGVFDGSGLTQASLRGGTYRRADYVGERVAAVACALRQGIRSLVYVYYGDVDSTGHSAGSESSAWRYQLAHADRLAEQVASTLPEDALLVITADHGMVDVPLDARIDIATTPYLQDGVRLTAGEPRALYVHAAPGAGPDVLAAWRETLGHVAWVVSRDEAVADGWYGPGVSDSMVERIGDVIVAARKPVAVVDSRVMPAELLALVGLHGSLTALEQIVPLLCFTSGSAGR